MIVRLLALIAALCFASAAQAQNEWSSPASACTPSDATAKLGRYKTNVASVQHATSNVDLIVLNCPIARFNNSGTGSWNLKMVYQDSTGAGTAAFARARLYAMGVNSATPFLLTTADSNSVASTGSTLVLSPMLAHSFNFEANIYWVRVELDRTLTSQTVIVHSVSLDGAAI
jgi:hypothetical protein